MNKLTKGTIAVGAAVLLLVGGGGTLAYWNSTVPVTGGDIAAGQLTATAAAGTFTVKHGSGTAQTVDIATYVAVPGDTITYSTAVTVTAEGTNLKFKATLADGSIAALPLGSPDAASTALAARLTAGVDYTLTTSDPGITVDNSGSSATATLDGVVGASKTYVVNVVVTITWPFGDGTSPVNDNPAQTGNVSLADLTLLVEQIPAS